jgi:hypothetical protein
VLAGSVFGAYLIFAPKTTAGDGTRVPLNNPAPASGVTSLFSDSFADNGNGWNLQSEKGKYSAAIQEGSLQLEDDDHKVLWEPFPGSQTYSDFKLYFDAYLISGDSNNGYGVYLRAQYNQNNQLVSYYKFEIYGDSTFAIFRGNAGSNGNVVETKLVDYKTGDTIVPISATDPQPNHILISAQGSTLTFTVNASQIAQITNANILKGTLALFVSNLSTSSGGGVASFKVLSVYPPNA